MSILSRLTVTPTPLLYASGALLVLSVGLATALVVQDARHAAALAELTTAKQAAEASADIEATKAEVFLDKLRELAQTNGQQRGVVDDLAHRLKSAIGQAQATARVLADVIEQRDAAHAERDRTLAQLTQLRETLYANDPSCATWGARPVCGALSDSLRDQWTRARTGAGPAGDAGPGGGGRGAAAGADRPHPDRSANPAAGPTAGETARSGL